MHINIIRDICKYQVGTAMWLGFVKHFTVKSQLTCTYEAILSNIVSFKFFQFIRLGQGALTMYVYWEILQFI
jgi:hypothetical protein